MAYGFKIEKLGENEYRIGWTVDFGWRGCVPRHSRSHARIADQRGAVKFALRHGILMPPEDRGEE